MKIVRERSGAEMPRATLVGQVHKVLEAVYFMEMFLYK
jgi:hypothetical protein